MARGGPPAWAYRTPYRRPVGAGMPARPGCGSGSRRYRPAVRLRLGLDPVAVSARALRQGGHEGLGPPLAGVGHGTAAGLKVISIVLAAAKAAGVSPQRVIDVMAKEIPWRGDALRGGEDEDDNFAEVHELFQGTLVKTVYDEKTRKWKAVTAGARRDLYQLAADKVLKQVAAKDASLKPVVGLSTFQAIGLAPSAGRGRPKEGIRCVMIENRRPTASRWGPVRHLPLICRPGARSATVSVVIP